jgi:catechol 2,3-dioxygenase-like lactoylglutathione lyase family enzyme
MGPRIARRSIVTDRHSVEGERVMAVKGIFYVLLYVSDLAVSKRFYREQLGWNLGTDEEGIAGFSFGSSYLVLHADNRPAHERVYGGGMHIEVQVDDVEAEHTHLEGQAVSVSAIRDQPWGERQFDFIDPDGYRWMYGQTVQSQ